MKHVDVFATRGTQRLYAQKRNRTASVGLEVTRCTDNFSTVCPQKNSARRSSPVSHRIQRLWLLSVCRPRIRATLRIHLYSVAENGEVAHHGPPADPAEGTAEVVA